MVVGMTAAELQAEFGLPNAYPIAMNGLMGPVTSIMAAHSPAALKARFTPPPQEGTFGLTDSMAFGIPNYWIYGAVGLLVVLPWLKKKKKG